MGLYDYPVLMAADILLYRATHVPVGEDQKQHLELSRDIAQKFNNDFADSIRSHGSNDGLFFPQPEPFIIGPATRVMSLRDGTKKMSKSDASDNSRINLTDDADTIAQKVRKAKTDPEPLPSEEKGLENRPEADNLVGIYAALSERSKADVLKEFGGGQFSSFKNALVELCVAKLSPIASEMKRLVADPGHVDKILVDGADRARVIADETMRATRDIVGFIRKRSVSEMASSGDRRSDVHPIPWHGRRVTPSFALDPQENHRPGTATPLVEGGCAVAACGGLAQHRDMHDHPATKLRDGSQAKMPCHR